MKPYSSRKWLVVIMQLVIFFGCTKPGVETPIPNNPPLSPDPAIPARTQINAQLTEVGTLSQGRRDMAIISAGNKLFFAGGSIDPRGVSSRVDIYDISTNSWAIAELSQARSHIASAASGKNVYFGGGLNLDRSFSSRVDIYNTETNSWSISELPEYKQYLTGAAAGNKVVFAGGDKANILDVLSNTWKSSPPLSLKPGDGCCQGEIVGISSTVIGDAIYFAGGGFMDYHSMIDIFNATTDTWSISKLKYFGGFFAGIAVGNSNYWAGGNTWAIDNPVSKLVEIRDSKTGLSKIDTLFQANSFFSAALRNDTIVFFTGTGKIKDKFDIYSTTAKTWSIGILPFRINESDIFSSNNSLFVAGGKLFNEKYYDKLWKLDF